MSTSTHTLIGIQAPCYLLLLCLSPPPILLAPQVTSSKVSLAMGITLFEMVSKS